MNTEDLNTEDLVNMLCLGKGDFLSKAPVEDKLVDSLVESIIYGSSCMSVKWDAGKQEFNTELVDCKGRR